MRPTANYNYNIYSSTDAERCLKIKQKNKTTYDPILYYMFSFCSNFKKYFDKVKRKQIHKETQIIRSAIFSSTLQYINKTFNINNVNTNL